MSDETIKCASCGAALVAGSGFCGQCGAPVGPAIPPPSPMYGTPTAATASADPISPNKGRNEPFKEATEPESFPPPPPPAPAPTPFYVPPATTNVVAASGSDSKGIMAIVSLVIGVLSLCAWLLPICGCPLAIIGVVLGVLGLKSDKKTLAIVGLVLCGIALVLCLINGIAGAVIGSSNPDFLQNLFNQ
ncbi:MAG TPA: DUF4190 domain-containing protein [Anaerolineaceae bacterium]|nr:DUF4190 domain-containing protein [Anaerolineaceae bacterium]